MVPPKRRYLRRYRLNFYPRPRIYNFATGTPKGTPPKVLSAGTPKGTPPKVLSPGDPERNPTENAFGGDPDSPPPPKMLSTGTPVRRASMAKQADARDLKSLGTSRIGSNPITRTSAGAGRIGPRPCFLLRFSADSVESGVHGGYPSARQAAGHGGASPPSEEPRMPPHFAAVPDTAGKSNPFVSASARGCAHATAASTTGDCCKVCRQKTEYVDLIYIYYHLNFLD